MDASCFVGNLPLWAKPFNVKLTLTVGASWGPLSPAAGCTWMGAFPDNVAYLTADVKVRRPGRQRPQANLLRRAVCGDPPVCSVEGRARLLVRIGGSGRLRKLAKRPLTRGRQGPAMAAGGGALRAMPLSEAGISAARALSTGGHGALTAPEPSGARARRRQAAGPSARADRAAGARGITAGGFLRPRRGGTPRRANGLAGRASSHARSSPFGPGRGQPLFAASAPADGRARGSL